MGGFTALHAKGTGFDSPCPLHPWDVWQSPVTLLPYYIMGDKDMEYLEESILHSLTTLQVGLESHFKLGLCYSVGNVVPPMTLTVNQ